MTKKEIYDMSASVKQRLLNVHTKRKIDFNFLFTRYAVECFLHRLDRSIYKERFILKGAMLFNAWKGESFRPTRDLDFLGFEKNDPQNLKRIFKEICTTKYDWDDGLVFVAESITTEAIKEEDDYPGVRVHVGVRLGKARNTLQIDVGFGDKITPGIKKIKYPSILGDEELTVWAYPLETVIAEKFEAMVSRGQENSRMKDFYDLWAIVKTYPIKGKVVIKAIQTTCKHRGTNLFPELALALTIKFYEGKAKQIQWQAFLKKSNLLNAPQNFAEVGEKLIVFFEPLRSAIASQDMKLFNKNWHPERKWIVREEKIDSKKK
jgi:hypothetical protein